MRTLLKIQNDKENQRLGPFLKSWAWNLVWRQTSDVNACVHRRRLTKSSREKEGMTWSNECICVLSWKIFVWKLHSTQEFLQEASQENCTQMCTHADSPTFPYAFSEKNYPRFFGEKNIPSACNDCWCEPFRKIYTAKSRNLYIHICTRRVTKRFQSALSYEYP